MADSRGEESSVNMADSRGEESSDKIVSIESDCFDFNN